MVPSDARRREVMAVAYRSFIPESREQAVAQFVVAGLSRRRFRHENGMPPAGIGWNVAKGAIKLAQRIKRAADWQAELHSIIFGPAGVA